MNKTKIEWTDRTWNPVTGCSKVSEGCRYCYAETMTKRLKGMGLKKYCNGFSVTLHPECLDQPQRLTKGYNIFVCSMGDLFHKDVPTYYIDKVMNVIISTPRHTYQILTKRPERMNKYFSTHRVPRNVFLGVTVENAEHVGRIDLLRGLDASVKFLSCEPLLSDLGRLNLDGIDWIIVGGETGVNARPMMTEWVTNIQQQANDSNIPFFFKAWGTWGSDGIKRDKKANGNMLLGRTFTEMPKYSYFTT